MEYRRLISSYEKSIGEKESMNVYSPLYFALLYNLHQKKKHFIAATHALDGFDWDLEENSSHKTKWCDMLNGIKELKEKSSKEESFEIILNSIMDDNNRIKGLWHF